MGFAIGIENTKTATNVGTLWRSAYNFGAQMVFTVGKRYKNQPSDTVKAWRHIPLLHFGDWQQYKEHAPQGWENIGVEILPTSKNIKGFSHPKQAVYILGAEDCGLSQEAIAICKHIIHIPSKHCLNVSVAGSIIMFDRTIKLNGESA